MKGAGGREGARGKERKAEMRGRDETGKKREDRREERWKPRDESRRARR